MSGSIKKIQSSSAMPLNKRSNILRYDLGEEAGQVDMKASYLELQLTIDGVTDYTNVVTGRDGLLYNPACLFRRAGLSEARTGKVLQNLTYVNILSQNLDYFSKGCNALRAETLFSGAGILSPDGTHYKSIFSNDYSDKPGGDYYLRVPLSLLYPGSIGDSDMLPQSADWSFDFLLEPAYKCFMRAFPAIDSTGQTVLGGATPADASTPAPSLGCTTWTVADGTLFPVGTCVLCTYKVDGVSFSKHNYVTVVNVNVLTFANVLNAGTVDADSLVIKKVTNSFLLSLRNFPALGGVDMTLSTACPVPVGLEVGSKIKVTYNILNVDGTLTPMVSNNVVAALVTGGVAPNVLTGITLTTGIPLAAGTYAVNLHTSLATTNIDGDYNVTSAHMVVYRRNVPMSAPQNMLVTNFESVNISMVEGINKFSYTVKMDTNTYNAFVLTPSNSNMYSTRSDNGTDTDTKIITSYLYYIDEKPLTNIILQANSSAHYENVVKTFSNSEIYPLANLRKQRDVEFKTDIVPFLFPTKIFPSVIKGDEMNVQPEGVPDRNLKIDLYADDGKVTPLKSVFIFLEKYDRV
jgi:hypothetical protein